MSLIIPKLVYYQRRLNNEKKSMKYIPVAILILTFFVPYVSGQCETRMRYANGDHPVAIYALMKDYRGYTNRRYTGKIVHIQYDSDNGVDIVGFVIEPANGVRESIDITHDDCVSEMSSLDKKWLPYLIKKNNTVRIDAEISGSGGFINARNILLIQTRKKSPKKLR